MKAVGQGTGEGAETNTSGFSALLAGYRSSNGYFLSFGSFAYFRSSTEIDADDAFNLAIDYLNIAFYLANCPKDYGFSVRCLED